MLHKRIGFRDGADVDFDARRFLERIIASRRARLAGRRL
jgi:hypothetical protein